ncbi:Uncharacterized protein TCM_002672 [Theobroma cacao]|uniref:Uncharacterized protein n=1 Tax=Theobroma cacao TaxID=3641 RepID=A0A061DLU0_THECC|nr:Uncharacterized protein TCM_002672 [Theobroma cacao]
MDFFFILLSSLFSFLSSLLPAVLSPFSLKMLPFPSLLNSSPPAVTPTPSLPSLGLSLSSLPYVDNSFSPYLLPQQIVQALTLTAHTFFGAPSPLYPVPGLLRGHAPLLCLGAPGDKFHYPARREFFASGR